MESPEALKRKSLPWLDRDHQRIRVLVESVASASRRTATQFVLHRLMEDLRSLCRRHFDRQQHALARAGLGCDHHEERNAVLARLADAQASLRCGQLPDREALVDFLVDWCRRHTRQCSSELNAAAARSSRHTHWDLVHTEAIRPYELRVSIPPDPQTSGSFLL